jgi:hypothetical protein
LPSLALSNRHLVHRSFRRKLAMLVLPQSDPLQFGYLFDQHQVRRYHLIYACDDVYDGVYVCDGFQVGREFLVSLGLSNQHLLLRLNHCILEELVRLRFSLLQFGYLFILHLVKHLHLVGQEISWLLLYNILEEQVSFQLCKLVRFYN